MKTLSDLFKAFKGVPKLADAIGQKAWTVQKWKNRKRIPGEHWPALIEAARERGIRLTADDLLVIHSAPAPKQRRSESRAVGG